MTGIMNDPASVDPRIDQTKNPMPFDGSRMIYGGFTRILAA